MFKRALVIFTLLFSFLVYNPTPTLAAAGIFPSGGKTVQEGINFTVYVTASGATFDSLQGTISVSGPVSIVSFWAGSATWLPGKTPGNNNQFVGIVSPKSSLTVASITLRGTSVGSGSVKVTGARLARNGSEVGSSGGTTFFSITRAPTPPGQVTISSSTHPDQEKEYDETTAKFSWKAPANGASGYSIKLDDKAKTDPEKKVNTEETSKEYKDLKVGTHYFHVRALNSDGWGTTAHFKINIKPSTDNALAAPTITLINKLDGSTNDLEKGTLKGLQMEGTGPVGYSVVLAFTPDLDLPEDKYPTPKIGDDGSWRLLINEPLKSGFYKVTTQASKEGVVSAVSEPTLFEISVKNGGEVNIISISDETATFKAALEQENTRVAAEKDKKRNISYIGWGIILLVIGTLLYLKRQAYFRKKS